MDSHVRLKLTKQLVADEEFVTCTTNQARANYLLSKVQSWQQFRDLIVPAVDKARSATCKSATTTECFLTEASVHCSQSDFDAALTSVHKALLYSPAGQTKAKLYIDKATIHLSRQNYQAALWSVDMALQMLPSDCVPVEYGLMRVKCLRHLGHYKEAIQVIDQLVNEHAGNTSDHQVAAEDLLILKTDLQVLMNNFGDRVSSSVKTDASVGEEKEEQQKTTPKPMDSDDTDKLDFVHEMDSRVSIVRSDQVGRYCVAREQIAADTVVVRERPISVVLERSVVGVRCWHCHHCLHHRFVPCDHCIEAVFCDPSCVRAAQHYHRVECRIAGLVRSVGCYAFHVFKMIAHIGGPVAAMHAQSTNSQYDIDQYLREMGLSARAQHSDDNDSCGALSRYLMASALANNNDQHDTATNAYHTIVATELAVLLDQVFHYRRCQVEPEFVGRLVAMLVVDIRRVVYNVFGWHLYEQRECDDGSDTYIKSHVANCQCLVASLLNHSCDANVTWEWRDGVIWLITNRPIAAGDQLTVSYGPHRAMAYDQRQQRLNHYRFVCVCVQCAQDARKADCLQCRHCSGPVLFHSVVNDEPSLNGRCGHCHRQYADFDRAVRRLTDVKERVRTVASLAEIDAHQPALLTQTVHLLSVVTDLAVVGSDSILNTVFQCSSVLERFPLHSLFAHRFVELVDLALLISSALPQNISTEQLNGRIIGSLRFWMDCLKLLWEQVSNHKDGQRLITTSKVLALKDALKSSRVRYMEALQFLMNSDESSVGLMHRLIGKQIAQLK